MLGMYDIAYRGFNGICGTRGFYGFHGGGIMGLVLLIVVAVVIYKMYKSRSFIGPNPLDELKMKYVNGELTEEEYLRKKEVLKKK